MRHHLLPALTLALLLAAPPAQGLARDPVKRDLGRIERFLSHRHLRAYHLEPLDLADPDGAPPRRLALARTEREPGGAPRFPDDPLFDTLAGLEGGRFLCERIGPFARSGVRVLDLDRDGELEAAILTLPARPDGRADFVVVERSGGVTRIDRVTGRGLDSYELVRDPESGTVTLLHRFMASAQAGRKEETRYRFATFGPAALDGPPARLGPPLHPTPDDAALAAGLRPWNRVRSRAHLAGGAKGWRGPDAFSFDFRLERTPTGLALDALVTDDRLDPRAKAGDRATVALAGMRGGRPLLARVRPDGGGGVRGEGLPADARLDPLPHPPGYGFRLFLPEAALSACGIRPDEPALLFRLDARNVEGPGLERHAQLLSTNGRAGDARADLSVLVTAPDTE